MKAIIITFNGPITHNSKKAVAKALATEMAKYTSAEEIDVNIVEDSEVASILVRGKVSNETAKSTESTIAPTLMAAHRFCNRFYMLLNTEEFSKVEATENIEDMEKILMLMIAKGKFDDMHGILKMLIHMSDSDCYQEEKSFLQKYKLAFAPEYLKQINRFYKIC